MQAVILMRKERIIIKILLVFKLDHLWVWMIPETQQVLRAFLLSICAVSHTVRWASTRWQLFYRLKGKLLGETCHIIIIKIKNINFNAYEQVKL